MVGNYLSGVNEARPKIGTIWETGMQTSNAAAILNRMADDRKNTRKQIQSADSLSKVAEGLQAGQWVSMDKNRFKTIYTTLEPSSAARLIEPVELIRLLNGSQLERIFCEGTDNGIRIYFIDASNRVIHEIGLAHTDIRLIESSETALSVGLSEMEAFKGRIYPADIFFNTVLSLPRDLIPDLIQNPELLLKQEGEIAKVGIRDQAENGYIVLGFEFKTAQGVKTLLLKGREWAVWQLSLNLKDDLQ